MFWKWCWIALRRFHKDKRFRGPVLLVSFWLAYFVASFIFAWKINREDGMGVWTFPFYGLTFGSGFLAFVLIRRLNRSNQQIFQHSFTQQPLRSERDCSASFEEHAHNKPGIKRSAQRTGEFLCRMAARSRALCASPGVQTYMIQRAGIIAGLVLRAASEMSLNSPDGQLLTEAGIRGAINKMLRKSKLWDQLEAGEADLFCATDGAWTSEQKYNMHAWCEQLRLLRWRMGVDVDILPLGHLPRPEVSLTEGLLDPERLLFRRKDMREIWEIRRERDVASDYTGRIISELMQRGLLDSDSLNGSLEPLLQARQDSSTDLIAGVKTVGELNDDTLRSLGSIAIARLSYAEYLMDQLEAQTLISYGVWATSKQTY